jgi:putative glutamine amidotransferase
MKPVIGVNIDVIEGPPRKVGAYSTYYEAVVTAGGIPLFIPPLPAEDLEFLFSRLDGLLLIGGDDYSPSLYGEELHPTTEVVSKEREIFDLALIKHCMKSRSLPVLGLCGGAQLINIAFGGSLIQDIGSQMPESSVKHKGEAGWKVKDWHEVQLQPGSKLMDIYKKERINVPTAHHQGLKNLGQGLKSAAFADDGVVEAVEATDYPFMVGVQWHPERNVANELPLFEAFLQNAKVKIIIR